MILNPVKFRLPHPLFIATSCHVANYHSGNLHAFLTTCAARQALTCYGRSHASAAHLMHGTCWPSIQIVLSTICIPESEGLQCMRGLSGPSRLHEVPWGHHIWLDTAVTRRAD